MVEDAALNMDIATYTESPAVGLVPNVVPREVALNALL